MQTWVERKMEERAYIDKVIRKHYAIGGPEKCMEFIKNRTKQQISRRANYLNIAVLRKSSGRHKGKGKDSDWEKNGWDDIIKEYYPTGGTAACFPFIPRTIVKISSRAHTIGVRMNEEDKKRIRGQASASAKATDARRKHYEAKTGDVELDPFISGSVPPSIFRDRLEKEYYL